MERVKGVAQILIYSLCAVGAWTVLLLILAGIAGCGNDDDDIGNEVCKSEEATVSKTITFFECASDVVERPTVMIALDGDEFVRVNPNLDWSFTFLLESCREYILQVNGTDFRTTPENLLAEYDLCP